MVEFNLRVDRADNNKYKLVGFTRENMRLLGSLARKKFKVKTKRKRIVKKYIIKLLLQSIRKQIAEDTQ